MLKFVTKPENIAPPLYSDEKSHLDADFFHEDFIDTEVIFTIAENVQLVTIRGEHTETSPPNALEILVVNRQKDQESTDDLKSVLKPNAFIRVGTWVYPLIREHTKILQNEYGIYVVPNPIADDPNMCVGILLPKDQPDLQAQFCEILKQYAEVRTSNLAVKSLDQEEKARLSLRIAKYLMKKGQKWGSKIESGGAKAGKYVTDKGESYRSNIKQNETPSNISPIIQSGVTYMHKGTKMVAKGTQFLLEKIGDVGTSVGTRIGDSVATGDGRCKRVLRNTFTVAGGGIAAGGMVFMSLESASKVLFKSLANETVETTRFKYGDEAADTTRHAFQATGHGAMAGIGIISLAPKALAGRVVAQGVGTAGMECIRADGNNNCNKLPQEKDKKI